MKAIVGACGLSLFRFVSCAWVGAAVLFVVTSIAEQTSPDFEATIRDQLATIRFPLYYDFGFAAYGLMFLGTLLFCFCAEVANRRRAFAILCLLFIAAVVFSLDYTQVYLPLQEEIRPPGKPRSPTFEHLHTMSRYANQLHVMLIFATAAMAVLPLQFAKKNERLNVSVDE